MNERPVLQRRGSGRRGRRERGFTLIELMVAVVIGMALVLAITLMLWRHEAQRRGLTASNDASSGGSYLAYTIDRAVRSAGSGYAQVWRQSFGCRLLASRGGTQILPRTSAFPAPFAAVPQTLRLAPVIIHAGAGTGGSDILRVATGSSGLSESPMRVLPNSATDDSLRVPATVGLRQRDLVLVVEEGTGCALQQVRDGFVGGADQDLLFGGTYADAEIDGVRLADLSDDRGWMAPIGNTAGNRPSFQLIGIDANGALVSLDLLRLDGNDIPTPIADGVADLRVLYGVDTTNPADGVVDTWFDPAVAPWDAATLQNNSIASQDNMARVLALRVGLLVRSTSPERTAVSPSTLTLFADLGTGLQRTRTLSAEERRLRWQALDFSVPLRNLKLMPRP